MPLGDDFVEVGGLGGGEGLEGKIIDLLRSRSNSIYPDSGIIPIIRRVRRRSPCWIGCRAGLGDRESG